MAPTGARRWTMPMQTRATPRRDPRGSTSTPKARRNSDGHDLGADDDARGGPDDRSLGRCRIGVRRSRDGPRRRARGRELELGGLCTRRPCAVHERLRRVDPARRDLHRRHADVLRVLGRPRRQQSGVAGARAGRNPGRLLPEWPRDVRNLVRTRARCASHSQAAAEGG